MKPTFELLIVTDRRGVPDPAAVLDRALTGVEPGRVAVMLREKDLPARPLMDLGGTLRSVTRRHGALFLVNDRLDVAVALEADGVHLPVSGVGVSDARRLLPGSTLVGCSTHGAAEVRAAAEAGADYATFGPVFDTPSKRAYGAPVGLAALARAASQLPLYGLGGVSVEAVPRVRGAGAVGCACIRAFWDADDPAVALRAFLAPPP